jgi:hypothetical protein
MNVLGTQAEGRQRDEMHLSSLRLSGREGGREGERERGREGEREGGREGHARMVERSTAFIVAAMYSRTFPPVRGSMMAMMGRESRSTW